MRKTYLLLAISVTLGACGTTSSGHEPQALGNDAPALGQLKHPDPRAEALTQVEAAVNREQLLDTAKTADLDTVRIQGVDYRLTNSDPGIKYSEIGDKNFAYSSGKDFPHARFLVASGFGPSYGLGYFGQPAQKLPSGKAEYRGYGLHITTEQNNNYESTITAQADFGDKSIAITVAPKEPKDFGEFKLNGTIDGDQFSGAQKLKGQFYGPQGEELAGMYHQEHAAGAFVAKKEEGQP